MPSRRSFLALAAALPAFPVIGRLFGPKPADAKPGRFVREDHLGDEIRVWGQFHSGDTRWGYGQDSEIVTYYGKPYVRTGPAIWFWVQVDDGPEQRYRLDLPGQRENALAYVRHVMAQLSSDALEGVQTVERFLTDIRA